MYSILTRFETDSPDPVECSTSGTIPDWLHGSLIRNGAGLFHIGPDKYKHLFDGMAVVHKYTIRDGSVTYQNRIIESETYKRNKSADRIVVSEFGTVGMPDPNMSLFSRYLSFYFGGQNNMTDNPLVTVLNIGDRLFALTETCRIVEIDPVNLQTKRPISLQDVFGANMATAHMLTDESGAIWNIGTSFSYPSKYLVLKIIPGRHSDKTSGDFFPTDVIASIPARWSLEPSYYHSFGMSENYIVFVEQTSCIPLLKMATAPLLWKSCLDVFNCNDNEPCLFHIINKRTGEVNKIRYASKSFFVLHHVNTYEDGGHLVVDLCAYPDSSILQIFKMDNIKLLSEKRVPDSFEFPLPKLWRFVLPLDVNKSPATSSGNLVKLKYTTARAIRNDSETIFCTPEIFQDFGLELPFTNPCKAGKPYRYCYGLKIQKDSKSGQFALAVVKYDLQTNRESTWYDERYIAAEPVFVRNPDGAEEDDGIIMVPLSSYKAELNCSLLFLDGRTFEEVGRAVIPRDIQVPFTFHGIFV